MLVLTRKTGESIRIGDEVAVRVLDVTRGHVRFAIDAPRHVPVHREEVYAQVREENRRAAAAATDAPDAAELWRRTQRKKPR